MALPDCNTQYREVDYWDTRYTDEDEFEWLKSYSSFRHLIRDHVKKTDRILMVGCGNSSLGPDMWKDGFERIVNADISRVCIEKQRKKYSACPSMDWIVSDMTRMTEFPTDSFDVVIEKATIDALLVGEKSMWNISEDTLATVNAALTEISRVLKPGGRFLSLTFAQPHFRLRLYAQPAFDWDCDYVTFAEENSSFHFYFFFMTKGRALDRSKVDRIVNVYNLQVQTVSDFESSDEEEAFVNGFNVIEESDSEDSAPSQ